jgi:SAM-dependent methyltransferase
LGPLPIDRVMAAYRHSRESTKLIRASLNELPMNCLEIYYEDIFIGDRDARLARSRDLLQFLDFTPEVIERNQTKIEETIFNSGQNTRSVASFVPNLQEVTDALAAIERRSLREDESGDAATAAAVPIGPHARITLELETLAAMHKAHGPYLEVYGGPPENAALLTKYFIGEERHAIGPEESATRDGVTFHQGDPNDMRGLFADGRFTTVLWNSALAHDRRFWCSLEEIKRVLAPGGVLIVATADFSKSAIQSSIKIAGRKGTAIANATLTQAIHPTRPDYWRISPQAMRKTILDGFDIREVHQAMMPSQVFGVGVKPK